MSYSFPKSQRLRSRKEKDRLFRAGRKIFVHPLLLRWLPVADSSSNPSFSDPQVMFLVAKKKFPRAVDRNGIRRKLREAWRLNAAQQLAESSDALQSAVFLVQYVAGVPLTFVEIQSVLCDTLQRLPRKAAHNDSE